ncbi:MULTISPECIES: (2Fe-2S)-binding protein [Hyphobacterium]|uniref:Bacterioferritin-associated ferredoxin n=1 Tax=Hyphobacterium vulgare TaxID=1736751 RepID=A0ABV6ZY37_9PROT
MYVCICNALKHGQLSAAAADPSVESVPHLFKSCGARPKCGRCIDDMADLMSAVRQPESAALAAE